MKKIILFSFLILLFSCKTTYQIQCESSDIIISVCLHTSDYIGTGDCDEIVLGTNFVQYSPPPNIKKIAVFGRKNGVLVYERVFPAHGESMLIYINPEDYYHY